jgi:hypothetical protein
MKKFLAGVVVGYMASELIGAYQLGYFHRMVAYYKWLWETDEIPPVDFSDVYKYITTGRIPPMMYAETVEKSEAVAKTARAMAMEHYDIAQIAEYLGLEEEVVRQIVNT